MISNDVFIYLILRINCVIMFEMIYINTNKYKYMYIYSI